MVKGAVTIQWTGLLDSWELPLAGNEQEYTDVRGVNDSPA